MGILALAACGNTSVPAQLVLHYDAGSDAAVEAAADAGGEADAPEDDAGGVLGGECVDDAQCDQGIKCEYFSCDKVLGRCRYVPDDTQCQDGVYCDGEEQCVVGHGCEPGPPVSCDNGDECQTATCVEATKSCKYVPRDVDRDGDPDGRCFPGHDCNDLNPDVSSLHAEVCANHVDDNCNHLIDEMPCVLPQGQSCPSAIAVGGAGSYALSTVGCNDVFATSCSVAMPSAAQTVVAAVTVPAGGDVDLEVWVKADVPVAAAIDGRCGDSSSELACGAGNGATEVRARAYAVAPGTYYAVVVTQKPTTNVELEVDLLPPTPPATNVDCASAAPVTPGTPVTVQLVNPPTDLPTACPGGVGELTYSFTLAQTQDVRVYASTAKGGGSPIVGLRDPGCTAASDELSCEAVGQIPLYEQSLPAGTYVVTVSATAPLDASVDVELSPPTAPAPNQTCTAPPTIAPNGTTSFDLSDHESAVKDGCFSSGPDAAYDLSLAAASDVLLVERIPQTESGGVSLDAPACTASTRLGCATGADPVRLGVRNVPAGDYRAVVADELGLQGTLDALVRDTVAPTIVPSGGAAACATAVDASAGGFFTGDTSTVPPGTAFGCDAPSAPPGGELTQLLALNLAQPRRVVLDMEGSGYETILDVRSGPACPGSSLGDCYVGFGPQRSFLDLQLGAGSYWVLVSGYGGAKGKWDLDVRVLPP